MATKDETLFNLRYATRVLQLYGRFWHKVDVLTRISSLFAGSGAIAALFAQHATLALTAGLAFAFIQAVEYGIAPGKRSDSAVAQAKAYATVEAQQFSLNECQLEAAYEAVVAEDELVPSKALQELAFNDVCHQLGCGESHCYPPRRMHALYSLLS